MRSHSQPAAAAVVDCLANDDDTAARSLDLSDWLTSSGGAIPNTQRRQPFLGQFAFTLFIRTVCLHLAVIQSHAQLGNGLCNRAFGLTTQTAQVEKCVGEGGHFVELNRHTGDLHCDGVLSPLVA